MKINKVTADKITSKPKNPPIRVENNSVSSNGKFSPCSRTHGTNFA
jgi:hypothetical protein